MFSSTQLFSPRELFERIAPSAPPHLIPQETISRLLDLGDLLPPLDFYSFMFESFLGERKPKADFSLCLNPSRVHDKLQDWFNLSALPRSLQENTGWQELVAFIESATQIELFKKHSLVSLWLEFDIGSKNDWPPSPNVFWGNLDGNSSSIHLSLGLLKNEALRLRVQSIITAATAFRLKVRYIGWMFGRALDWTKIVLQITPNDLEQFLKTISYPYSIEPVTKIVHTLFPCAKNLRLQLDVSEKGVGPKIGIECIAGKENAPFIKAFLAEKLITEEDHQAILSWEGGKRYTCNAQEHILHRFLFHFKIVYHPEMPIQTKAYLAGFWAE